MLDLDFELSVSDGARRFDLALRLQTDARVVALYGPSGSGKSLTLQSVAGLLTPARGHVRIAGQTLYDSDAGVNVPARARQLGYLFQDYALFPHLSVRQNVAFGLTDWLRRQPSREHAERIDALLRSFGLEEMADSRPATLSGGQRQRVALARALAREPRALLLDEPFAALNPMLRAALRQELAELAQAQAMPMLMITHDVEDVLALADVAFLYGHGTVTHQIDLRDASSRELARERLDPASTLAQGAHQQKLRGLFRTLTGTR